MYLNTTKVLKTKNVTMIKVVYLLALQLLTLLTTSQILAIDYGTMYIKAALVHTGAGKSFSIVENPKSNRKFINSVQIILFRSASTTRKGFMKQTLLPNDQEDHLIASFTLKFSSICMTIQVNLNESRRSSFFSTFNILKVTN